MHRRERTATSTEKVRVEALATCISKDELSANATMSDAASKKILHQKRWVCDVCKVKWFLDFDDACAHEEQCKLEALLASSSSSNAVSKKVVKSKDACTLAKTPATSAKDKNKNDGASPTITPPPQSKKAAAILAAARARARGVPPIEKTDKKAKKTNKSIDIEILSDAVDDKNKVNVVELVEGSPKESSNRRSSKRLRDATPPAKSNHDFSSSNETIGKTAKMPKAIAKTNKPTASKSTSLKPGKKEKKGGPVASFFLPKSQQQTQMKSSASNHTKKRVVETNKGQSKKRTQTSTKSSKRQVLEIDDSSSSDEDDEVVLVEKANKKPKKNMVLGLSKADLQEHQAADFFARRKKKAEEERERQRKRDEARMARLKSKNASSKDDSDSVMIIESCNAASSSSKVTAGVGVAAAAAAAKKISLLQTASESSHTLKGLPAPRFPCPSLIVTYSSESGAVLKSNDSSSTVLSNTPKFQYSKLELAATSDEDEDGTISMGFLDKSDLDTRDNDICSAFFDCSKIQASSKATNSSQLWVDKYTMRKIPDDVVGDDNKDASIKLVEFIEEWKVRRHKAMQSMGQVKRKKKRRKKKNNHGYDFDDDFLDDGGLENVFLISGPCGSGKTRLVHSVAEQCECAIIEINTSEQRGGQALKRAVQETTQSHSSLAVSRRKQAATGFFGNGADNDDDLVDSESDSDRYDSDAEHEEKEDGHSLTIILIDEGEINRVRLSCSRLCFVCNYTHLSSLSVVDLLFEEDTAFWPALAQLSQKAKCPIVLTSTLLPPQLYYNSIIKYKHIELMRPSPAECSAKIDQVRKAEGIAMRGEIDQEGSWLSLIAETYQCDLRKILNEMQIFRYKSVQSDCSDMQQLNLGLSQSKSNTFVFTDFETEFPVILDIEPKILHRGRYSVLTIEGENLLHSELFFGDQRCEHFAVVNDNKIIAVCPPCRFPKGVSRDAIYEEDQHLDCLSCKFVEVSLRKRCPNSRLLLHSNITSSRDSNIRTNWNVEYDIPLREGKFDQQMSREAFIREAKANLKRHQKQNFTIDSDMSSEDEFENIYPAENLPEKVDANEEEEEEEAEVEMTDEDARVLLNQALSNVDVTSSSLSKEETKLSRETLQQISRQLNAFADDLARVSDASLLEDSFSLPTPTLSGAVEGFGRELFDSDTSDTDPTIDKLSKGKNKKPPSFDTLYETGVNESGFFFGASDAYVCHPNRLRERKLLSLSETNSRGVGQLDIELKEDVVEADSNSGFDTVESDSLFPLIPTRNNNEDDILLKANESVAILSLPSLLMQHCDELENFAFTRRESPLLDLKRTQIWKDSIYVMYDLLVHGKSWCFDLRHGECSAEELTQQKLMTKTGSSTLGGPLALDYLPYLREISLYENKARRRVQEMIKQNGDTGRTTRKTRSSRRNIRRHYLEESFPGRFDGDIDAISAQLAQSYMS